MVKDSAEGEFYRFEIRLRLTSVRADHASWQEKASSRSSDRTENG